MNKTMKDLMNLQITLTAELEKLLPERNMAKEKAYAALYDANEADDLAGNLTPEVVKLYTLYDELDKKATVLDKKVDLIEDTLSALRELKEKLTDLIELYN